MLKRFTLTLKQLPKVKAIVVWGEKALPVEEKDPRFFLWKDFLKLALHGQTHDHPWSGVAETAESSSAV